MGEVATESNDPLENIEERTTGKLKGVRKIIKLEEIRT